MLNKLIIENYALIHQLEIDFSEGFSVITGETGAGKSILVGALSLILGQRADSSVLLDKGRKCIVEGIFGIRNYPLKEFFGANNLDYDSQLILRREIQQNGKSRAFINDTPVNLTLLKELSEKLVNIHSQHSIITLNDTDFQLAVIDSFAGLSAMVNGYHENYLYYARQKKELEQLVDKENRARSEKDWLQFQLDELKASGLLDGEQETTEQRLSLLSHAGEIRTKLGKANFIFNGDEVNLLGMIAELISLVGSLGELYPGLKEFTGRLQSNQIDLKDIHDELARIEESIELNPAEAEALTNRLDLIYRLQKKHNASSVRELIAITDDLDKRLKEVDSLQDQILSLEKDLDVRYRNLAKKASEISVIRKRSLPEFESKIREILSKLALPDARIVIRMETVPVPVKDGIDRIRFLFSANKGIPEDEVSKIASGGELSRLMLGIKSLISEKNLLPTIIFDEIDSGVSGEIAAKVGTILKSMASKMQVIAITHLPQIAGKGKVQYSVYKESAKETVRSMIRKLSTEERVVEIAKMLSSEKVTESAYKTAKELMKN